MNLIRQSIINHASTLGFSAVGFAKADAMPLEKERLEKWLDNGYHGQMTWMENHKSLRTDPRELLPGATTVISLAVNYYPSEEFSSKEIPKIAKYAYGRDYHKVIRKKLKNLAQFIHEETNGSHQSRYFTDSAPILERDWALRAGLGWIGKNTLLINPRKGSFFFLAELITTLELEPDQPIDDFCGTCTRCIDACPTDAILPEGYIMDGSKCISYLTIELRDEVIPEAFKGKMENFAFGCDICQDVCPWNRFSAPHEEAEFNPDLRRLTILPDDWQTMDDKTFEELFSGSPVKRTGLKGMKRNVAFLQND